MKLDLQKVPIRPIQYEGTLDIPKDYYLNTGVLALDDVYVKLNIIKNSNQDDILNLECNGKFLLEDARTLNPISYPFHINIEEKIDIDNEICGRFLINSQNTLDIMTILWENIVLEIPIAYTTSEPLQNNEKQVGWEVVGEDSVEKVDPRMAPLMKLLDKEKE